MLMGRKLIKLYTYPGIFSKVSHFWYIMRSYRDGYVIGRLYYGVTHTRLLPLPCVYPFAIHSWCAHENSPSIPSRR